MKSVTKILYQSCETMAIYTPIVVVRKIGGVGLFYRRCKSYSYDDIVTDNSIFQGVKIPILNTFHPVFRITSMKTGLFAIELGTEVMV